MATPMIPPIKWAGITTSTLDVLPSKLSATRIGRLGVSRGTSEAASPLTWASLLLLLFGRRGRPPPLLLPDRPESWRRNHCVVVVLCVRAISDGHSRYRYIYVVHLLADLEQHGVGKHERVGHVGVKAQRVEQGAGEGDEDGVEDHGEALGAEADLIMMGWKEGGRGCCWVSRLLLGRAQDLCRLARRHAGTHRGGLAERVPERVEEPGKKGLGLAGLRRWLGVTGTN